MWNFLFYKTDGSLGWRPQGWDSGYKGGGWSVVSGHNDWIIWVVLCRFDSKAIETELSLNGFTIKADQWATSNVRSVYFHGLSAPSSEYVWKFQRHSRKICCWRYILQVKDDLFQTWPVNVSGDKDGLKMGAWLDNWGKLNKPILQELHMVKFIKW